jgi:hypothetical protein
MAHQRPSLDGISRFLRRGEPVSGGAFDARFDFGRGVIVNQFLGNTALIDYLGVTAI